MMRYVHADSDGFFAFLKDIKNTVLNIFNKLIDLGLSVEDDTEAMTQANKAAQDAENKAAAAEGRQPRSVVYPGNILKFAIRDLKTDAESSVSVAIKPIDEAKTRFDLTATFEDNRQEVKEDVTKDKFVDVIARMCEKHGYGLDYNEDDQGETSEVNTEEEVSDNPNEVVDDNPNSSVSVVLKRSIKGSECIVELDKIQCSAELSDFGKLQHTLDLVNEICEDDEFVNSIPLDTPTCYELSEVSDDAIDVCPSNQVCNIAGTYGTLLHVLVDVFMDIQNLAACCVDDNSESLQSVCDECKKLIKQYIDVVSAKCESAEYNVLSRYESKGCISPADIRDKLMAALNSVLEASNLLYGNCDKDVQESLTSLESAICEVHNRIATA